MAKSLTAKETLQIIQKLWATTEDIMKIGCCGNNKAQKIKIELRNKMIDEGYAVPRNMVDMKLVMDYFRVDEARIKKLAGGVTNGQ